VPQTATMNFTTLILSFLSLATGVVSQITAEKHLQLFHEHWDPVTKGPFALKNFNLDLIADDCIVRNPVGGIPDIVGKEAVIENIKLWEEALISLWWEVRSEFVQQDGVFHAFLNCAVVANNADKSATRTFFMDSLIRQELNEDGKIKLVEFYNDAAGPGMFEFLGSTAESPKTQDL
jgi:hypothetical protein